jgi:hypothetical protein
MVLSFSRTEDGEVYIKMKAFGDWYEATYDSDEWAGIVASVSKYGGTIANTMFAKQLHDGNIHSIHLLDDKTRQEIVGVDIAEVPLDEMQDE